jgi:REP element-mobilizing transposase RayT
MQVVCFVVMPNHVHLLATQFVPLARWLGPLKGFTANQAKKALGLRDGVFWQNESYDHLVRSDEEFRRIQRYIELNPVTAALVQKLRRVDTRAKKMSHNNVIRALPPNEAGANFGKLREASTLP